MFKTRSPSEKKPWYKHYRAFRLLYYGVVLATILVWGTAFLVSAVTSLLQTRQTPAQYLNDSFHRLAKGQAGKVFPWHTPQHQKKQLALEDIRDGKFRPNVKELQWINTPESITNDQGTYLLKDTEGERPKYVVKSIVDEKYQYTLFENLEFTYHGVKYNVDSLKASPDLRKAVLKTDTKKGWRHSLSGLFWLLDVASGDILPLLDPHSRISVVSWLPTSDAVAFIHKNNVYVKNLHLDSILQVTDDGSADIFNGKPDWVYEEEVFASDIVLWWSPKGDKMAFLKFNDAQVPVFSIPFYVQEGHEQYPDMKTIKYPKPGYPNPIVDVVVVTLPEVSGASFNTKAVVLHSEAIEDKLITEVLWVSDDFLLVKTTNRASDVMEVFMVNAVSDASSEIIRSHHAKDSWFEVTSNALFVPRNDSQGRYADGYIDIVSHNGYNHLAYFTPPNNPKPFMLTEGNWEVLSNHIDLQKNIVYFSATRNSSVERHIYSVNLMDVFHQHHAPSIKAVTSGVSWNSGSFSSGSRYLLLNYQGPDVPRQTLIDLHSGETLKVVEDNAKVSKALEEFEIPRLVRSQIDLGKDSVTGGNILANLLEIFPPFFDETKKYPVLFYVYGGPGSQLVTNEFAIGFSQVVASQLNAIVVTVDGRGTGYNNHDSKLGSRFKFCVRDQLGHFEPLDQIAAAKLWAEKPYVDESRIAIWGWSYGGFLTLKTLETDEKSVFSYGVAIAPVTKWTLYDSIYTERYLRTPQENSLGYQTASIQNAETFKKVKRFLIMHGSGDDNVHFQNSLRLVDDFNLANVENFDFMVFPDSDHSIRFHNGNTVVFDRIMDWIRRAFSGEFEPKTYHDEF